MRARSTIEDFFGLVGAAEQYPNSNTFDFERFRREAGTTTCIFISNVDRRYTSDGHQMELRSIWWHRRPECCAFGQTAKRAAQPRGQQRDHATIEQLLVMANIEGLNAESSNESAPGERLLKRLKQAPSRAVELLTLGERAKWRCRDPDAAVIIESDLRESLPRGLPLRAYKSGSYTSICDLED